MTMGILLLRLPAGFLAVLVLLASASLAGADPRSRFNELADLHHKQHLAAKYGDAERTAREMLVLAEGPLRRNPLWLAEALFGNAITRNSMGRYADAERPHRCDLEIRKAVYGSGHPEVATSLWALAIVLNHQARFSEAEALAYVLSMRMSPRACSVLVLCATGKAVRPSTSGCSSGRLKCSVSWRLPVRGTLERRGDRYSGSTGSRQPLHKCCVEQDYHPSRFFP